MRRVIYLLGPSGAGKTTLCRALLGPRTHTQGRWTIGARCAAAGPYTGNTLDGGDSLPRCMPVVEAMLDEIDSLPYGMPVLLDGQRWGAWAMAALRGKVTRVALLLIAPTRILVARRKDRGSPALRARMLDGQARSLRALARQADCGVDIDATKSPAAVLAAASKVVW